MRQQAVHRKPAGAEASAITDATGMILHHTDEAIPIEGTIGDQFFEDDGNHCGGLFGRLDCLNMKFPESFSSVGQKFPKTQFEIQKTRLDIFTHPTCSHEALVGWPIIEQHSEMTAAPPGRYKRSGISRSSGKDCY
jgi:hypothetical protein